MSLETSSLVASHSPLVSNSIRRHSGSNPASIHLDFKLSPSHSSDEDSIHSALSFTSVSSSGWSQLLLPAPTVPPCAVYFGENFRPDIDITWLARVCQHIEIEKKIDPSLEPLEFVKGIHRILLVSDLSDSTVAQTGLPRPISLPTFNGDIRFRVPILLQVTDIVDIGISGFALDRCRLKREALRLQKHLKLWERGSPITSRVKAKIHKELPPYPRGLLKLTLSDGTTSLTAYEDPPSRLSEISLGNTAVGTKLLLKSAKMVEGKAFIRDRNVSPLPCHTPDAIEQEGGRLKALFSKMIDDEMLLTQRLKLRPGALFNV